MDNSYDNPSTTKDMKLGKVDFRRHPYRGILAEIAKEDGVGRQAVQKRLKKGDPATLARVAEKVQERNAKVLKYRKAIRTI